MKVKSFNTIYKPNKLAQDNKAYLEWQQNGLIIDQKDLKAIKKAINEAGFTVEEVLSAVEELDRLDLNT